MQSIEPEIQAIIIRFPDRPKAREGLLLVLHDIIWSATTLRWFLPSQVREIERILEEQCCR